MRKLVFSSLVLLCAVCAFAQGPSILVPEGSSLMEVIPASADGSVPIIREYASACPVAVVGNVAMTIGRDTTHVFEIPISHPVADVRWLGTSLFYPEGKQIMRSWEDGSVRKLLEADAPVSAILPALDGILFTTDNSLVFCDYEQKTGRVLHQSKGKIILGGIHSGHIFFAEGADLYAIRGKQKVKFHSAGKASVKALAVHPEGPVFYSTADGTYLLNTDYRRLRLTAQSAKAIDIVGDKLFLSFADGQCVMVNRCGQYKEILLASEVDGKDGIGLLTAGHIPEAVRSYSAEVQRSQDERSAGEGVPADLLGEYAYALALSHDFDAALANIERSRALGGKYADFYSAQILRVMGLDDAADELGKNVAIPWNIRNHYEALNKKYASRARLVSGTPAEVIKTASTLAAAGQSVQALAKLGDLKQRYPENAVIYSCESTVWESLKHYRKAAQSLEKALSLTPSTADNLGRRTIYGNHLNTLKTKFDPVPAQPNFWKDKVLGYDKPRLMVYGGATLTSGLSSLNMRLGLYTSACFSASLNLGIARASKTTTGTIGISAYKTIKYLIFGMGISDSFSKGSNVFTLNPSAGVSFPAKDGMSSTDVMLGLSLPLSSGVGLGYSISVGRTFYFDFNLKKK
ncbi:MAG: tetratricopeptide repeat protein [Bacteroidales bacterium]|nr:tetratricopeptide repeat protein [Bacteroidales bacterium]